MRLSREGAICLALGTAVGGLGSFFLIYMLSSKRKERGDGDTSSRTEQFTQADLQVTQPRQVVVSRQSSVRPDQDLPQSGDDDEAVGEDNSRISKDNSLLNVGCCNHSRFRPSQPNQSTRRKKPKYYVYPSWRSPNSNIASAVGRFLDSIIEVHRREIQGQPGRLEIYQYMRLLAETGEVPETSDSIIMQLYHRWIELFDLIQHESDVMEAIKKSLDQELKGHKVEVKLEPGCWKFTLDINESFIKHGIIDSFTKNGEALMSITKEFKLCVKDVLSKAAKEHMDEVQMKLCFKIFEILFGFTNMHVCCNQKRGLDMFQMPKPITFWILTDWQIQPMVQDDQESRQPNIKIGQHTMGLIGSLFGLREFLETGQQLKVMTEITFPEHAADVAEEAGLHDVSDKFRQRVYKIDDVTRNLHISLRMGNQCRFELSAERLSDEDFVEVISHFTIWVEWDQKKKPYRLMEPIMQQALLYHQYEILEYILKRLSKMHRFKDIAEPSGKGYKKYLLHQASLSGDVRSLLLVMAQYTNKRELKKLIIKDRKMLLTAISTKSNEVFEVLAYQLNTDELLGMVKPLNCAEDPLKAAFTGDFEDPALHLAFRCGNLKAAEYLLKKLKGFGKQVLAANWTTTKNALHIAVEGGLPAVKLIHRYCLNDIALNELWLELLDQKDSSNLTPLNHVIGKADKEGFKFIWETMPTVQRLNAMENKIFCQAVASRSVEITKTILQSSETLGKTFDNLNDTSIIDGMTPLFITALSGDTDMADLILDHIPREEQIDYMSRRSYPGDTFLHHAALEGHASYFKHIACQYFADSHLFMQFIASTQLPSVTLNNPRLTAGTVLHYAVAKQCTDMVEFILEQAKKDYPSNNSQKLLEIKDFHGKTCLELETSSPIEQQLKIYRRFLRTEQSYGMNLNLQPPTMH